MTRDQADLLFQVGAQRYQSGSMILTSNLTFGSSDTTFRRRQPAQSGGARSYRSKGQDFVRNSH
jgi:DNA replication protein DnaC